MDQPNPGVQAAPASAEQVVPVTNPASGFETVPATPPSLPVADSIPSGGDGTVPTASGDVAAAPAPMAPPDSSSPARPTAEDITVLQGLQGFELAGRQLYRAAVERMEAAEPDAEADPAVALLHQVSDDHDQWASTVGALLGVDAPQQADAEIVDAWTARFDEAASGPELAAVAYDFETEGLGHLLEAVAAMQSTDAVGSLLAVARVAGAQCVAFADHAGLGADLDAMLGTAEVPA